MALIECPECGNQISDKALVCPTCGFSPAARFLGGYEYRSKTKLFSLPLVHIVLGFRIHPVTGKIRVAKGIIAIGNIAVGGVSFGTHPLSGNVQDPNAVEFFKGIFGSCVEKLNQTPKQ